MSPAGKKTVHAFTLVIFKLNINSTVSWVLFHPVSHQSLPVGAIDGIENCIMCIEHNFYSYPDLSLSHILDLSLIYLIIQDYSKQLKHEQ